SNTPIAQLDRQYVLERCAAQPAPSKRTAAGDNQSTTSNGHEVGGHCQLCPGEKIRLDIGKDDGVVSEEILATRWESARQGHRTRRIRLHVEGVTSLGILSFAPHGIHLESWIARQGAFHETVLETRRPLDDEDAAFSPGRVHRHTP